MNIAKCHYRDFLKRKLATDYRWALRALEVVYNNQTSSEKDTSTTHVENGIGFTGHDAPILTSFYLFQKKWKFLSKKQTSLLHKKIPKYWEQVLKVSDQAKLSAAYIEDMAQQNLNFN